MSLPSSFSNPSMSLPLPLATISIISASLNFCTSGDRTFFTLSFLPFAVLPEPSCAWHTEHLSRYTSCALAGAETKEGSPALEARTTARLTPASKTEMPSTFKNRSTFSSKPFKFRASYAPCAAGYVPYPRKMRKDTTVQSAALTPSERIEERERSITAVKILQLDRRKSEGVGVPRFREPVIIPRHLVAEPANDIDDNRCVRPLIVEIKRAGRREGIQENRVAAHKAAAITHHRGHALHRFPHYGGVGEMICAAVGQKCSQGR